MVYEENQNAFVGTYEMAVRDPFHQNAEPAGEKRGRRMLRFTREKRRYIYIFFLHVPVKITGSINGWGSLPDDLLRAHSVLDTALRGYHVPSIPPRQHH